MSIIQNSLEIYLEPDSHMKNLNLQFLLAVLLASLTWLNGEKNTPDYAVPIDLELFNGANSILLIWTLPKDADTDSVIIYRSRGIGSQYKIIAELGSDQSRYNDNSIDNTERYFYKIEAKKIDGNSYTSSKNTPPFSRTVQVNGSLPIFSIIGEEENIVEIDNLITALLMHEISSLELNLEGLTQKAFIQLLMKANIRAYPWVELTILKDLDRFDWIENLSIWKPLVQNIRSELYRTAPFYRNQFLLTPEEWKNLIEEKTNYLQDRFETLSEVFYLDRDYLSQLPPVVAIGQSKSVDNKIEILLLVLNSNEIHDEKISLLNGDEHIKISSPEKLDSGDIVSAFVPDNWVQAELFTNEEFMLSIPLVPIENGSVVMTLDGEYFLSDSNNIFLYPALKKQDYWLNELVIQPEFGTVSLEIAGRSEDVNEYGIFFTDSLVWEITALPSFKVLFLDSSFSYGNESKHFFWVHLKARDEDELWEVIESRPCFINKVSYQGRIPDGGPWENVGFATLGEKNAAGKSTADHMIVPQIFVLYQNYPNPFNGETAIRFDLLQPAKISLYISDASGRIINGLLEQEELQIGTYHYIWSGENHSSGIYFSTINAEVDGYLPVVFSRKMIYLK